VTQLTTIGFSEGQARRALEKFKQVDDAIQFLLDEETQKVALVVRRLENFR